MKKLKVILTRIGLKLQPAAKYVKSLDWTRILSAFAYFPFIGWIFPMYAKPDSADCQKNAKEGFFFSAVVALSLLLVYLFRIFIADAFRLFSFIIVLLHMATVISYAAVSIYLTFRTYRSGSFRIPLLSVKAERLNI